MRRSLAPLLALALLTLLATPIAAKEWMEARLDAPIAMDTPGGTEILVGIAVTASTGEGMMPVEGSPIYLQLTGRYGDTTRAVASSDRTPGHYTVRIAIPAGGAREAEIGINGTTDMPMMLMNDPFAFGPITARTAQLAPPADTTTVVPPPAPVAVAPDPATVPDTEPAPAPASAPTVDGPGILAALVALGVGALVLVLVLVARRRHAAGPTPRSA
jgi:hypothetical protein